MAVPFDLCGDSRDRGNAKRSRGARRGEKSGDSRDRDERSEIEMLLVAVQIYAATAATEGMRSVLEVHGGEGKEATAAIFAGLWEEIYLGWEPNGRKFCMAVFLYP